MSVLSRVRRVGAIAAAIVVVVTWLLASAIGLLPGEEIVWTAGAVFGLLTLTSLCLLLALSSDAGRRRTGRAS
jgi:hypothetical protein